MHQCSDTRAIAVVHSSNGRYKPMDSTVVLHWAVHRQGLNVLLTATQAVVVVFLNFVTSKYQSEDQTFPKMFPAILSVEGPPINHYWLPQQKVSRNPLMHMQQ